MAVALSYSGEHCSYVGTLTENPYTAVKNKLIWMRFVPDSGYVWDSETITNNFESDMVLDEEYSIVQTTFTNTNQINVQIQILSWGSTSVEAERYIKFTPQAESTDTYRISESLTNATSNIDTSVEYSGGEVVDITVTPDSGYYFSTIPTISMGSETLEMAESEGSYSYSLTVTDNATVTATAVEKDLYSFTVDVTNATTNISPDTEYEVGVDIEVTVTADSGYYFSTAPTISYYVMGVKQTIMLESDDTGDYKKNFYTTFAFTSSMQKANLITLSGNAQVIPETDKYGIITMYNPTPTELKQIGEKRYLGGVDLGNYITSLIKVYVKIPQGDTAKVLLGGYDTDVFSNVVTNDIIETDCGTVEIVGNYNNAMDYENTTIEIYLPLIGFQQLEPVKVMNETLSLIYKTNVINGDTIACIYNTTGTLLYTFNANASFEIPYRLNDDIESKGKLEVNSSYLFGFTPFITVRYNKAYNTANVIANDNREVYLKDVTGYIRCSEVFNTVSTTATEKAEIEALLREGVIV